MDKKYLLGLDLGTSSVGWCLTDEHYNVIRKGGKSLWGVRLFDEAKAASDRRLTRCTRRRIARRKERIRWLQSLFAQEINAIDPGFFQRLELSKYHFEDRSTYFDTIQTLFIDKGYTDKEYYRQYPTIYHLREDLYYATEKKDIRLLYLAMHHMVKYRGNFLYNGENFQAMDTEAILKSFKAINEVLETMEKEKIDIDAEKIATLAERVRKDGSISGLKESLLSIFSIQDRYLKKQLIPLMSGSKVKVKELYEIEDEDVEIKQAELCFKDENIDLVLDAVLSSMDQENYRTLILEAKNLFNMFTLGRLLKNATHLSEAMVNTYKNHHQDLKELKRYIKNAHPDKYKAMFQVYDEKVNNYVHYVGLNRVKNVGQQFKKCAPKDFYTYVRAMFGLKSGVKHENEYLQSINEKMTEGTFLSKQNSTDNGVYPVQMNLVEMQEILNRQKGFYPFLQQCDESGLSTAEKIEKILLFKIPYYVGPLAYNKQNPSFSWSVRRVKGEKITPWNFDKVIDKEKSAEVFITRMLNRCTYLPNEFCLPKHSILYSVYCLLSELNKIFINGHKITFEQKKEVIEELFLKQKVTKKGLEKYFKHKTGDGHCILTYESKKEMEEIQTNLTALQSFSNIFGLDYVIEHIDRIEDIIRDITLFEDKDILEKRFKKVYGLEDHQIAKLKTFTYQGYGRLSKALLVGLKTPIVDSATGEVFSKSILQIMFETNQNLMEILAVEEYTFKSQIVQANEVEEDNKQDIVSYVDQLYVSPGMKRPLIQAYRIIEELKTIIQQPIDEFYIECMRSGNAKKERTESRKDKLLRLYNEATEVCKKETELSLEAKQFVKEQKENIARREILEFRSDKLYLYFLQMGKCMYSHQPISIHDLYDSAKCDIDHIIPKSILKDDSIENRVLVLQNYNRRKSDEFPINHSVLFQGHKTFYGMLKKLDMMGDKKFFNLLRRDALSPQELEGFVNRQLVYTSQSVKALAQMIYHFEKVDESKVIFSKADLVSDFRKQYELIKCRDVNNLHHAHDAYLNIIVGRAIRAYFGKITFGRLQEMQDRKQTLNVDKILLESKVIKKGEVIYWNGKETIEKIEKQIYHRHDILVTVRQYVGQALFEKVGLLPASKAKGDSNLFPIKKPMDQTKVSSSFKSIQKYGGYTGPSNGYYCLVKSKDKKGQEIVSIEAMQNIFVSPYASKEKKREYLVNNKKLIHPEILHDLLRINLVLEQDKSRYCVTGKTNVQLITNNLSQAIFDFKFLRIMKKVSKYLLALKNLKIIDSEERLKLYFPIKDNKIIISPAKNDFSKVISLDKKEIEEAFTVILNKSTNKIYQNISPIQNLIKSSYIESRFSNLNLYNQIFVIGELQSLISGKSSTVNLEFLGLSKHYGKSLISKNIKNVKIIHESVTGYYQKVIYDGTKK